jgi:hypothetical protein
MDAERSGQLATASTLSGLAKHLRLLPQVFLALQYNKCSRKRTRHDFIMRSSRIRHTASFIIIRSEHIISAKLMIVKAVLRQEGMV